MTWTWPDVPTTNRYFTVVDASLPNNTHAFQLQLVGHGKHVLELGCAAGHMTRALRDQGCRVVAVDVDPDGVRLAGEFAEIALAEDLSRPDALATIEEASFDVVLAGDVLEHLPDPLSVLQRCWPLLKPDGALAGLGPDVAHVDLKLALLRGHWRYRDWGLLDRTHLRFFTRSSLDELLHTAGFVPVELRRVVKPHATTEFETDVQPVDAHALELALSDPEAETYQFVVRALRDTDGSALASAHSDLELATLVEAEVARRRGLEAEVATLTSRLREAMRELDALPRSKTFRYSGWARRLYGRVRTVGGR